MSADGLFLISIGSNFIQLALWIRERRLRLAEKEKFAKYIKSVDKRLLKMEKKDRLLQNS